MVNILTVDIRDLLEKWQGTDRLFALFALVGKANDSWTSGLSLDTREGQREWKEVAAALAEELHEAADCVADEDLAWRDAFTKLEHTIFRAANVLKQRRWVQTQYHTDLNHLYDEIADSIWFFICLLQLSGLDAEGAFRLFLKKYQVNQFRKDTGY